MILYTKIENIAQTDSSDDLYPFHSGGFSMYVDRIDIELLILHYKGSQIETSKL